MTTDLCGSVHGPLQNVACTLITDVSYEQKQIPTSSAPVPKLCSYTKNHRLDSRHRRAEYFSDCIICQAPAARRFEQMGIACTRDHTSGYAIVSPADFRRTLIRGGNESPCLRRFGFERPGVQFGSKASRSNACRAVSLSFGVSCRQRKITPASHRNANTRDMINSCPPFVRKEMIARALGKPTRCHRLRDGCSRQPRRIFPAVNQQSYRKLILS